MYHSKKETAAINESWKNWMQVTEVPNPNPPGGVSHPVPTKSSVQLLPMSENEQSVYLARVPALSGPSASLDGAVGVPRARGIIVVQVFVDIVVTLLSLVGITGTLLIVVLDVRFAWFSGAVVLKDGRPKHRLAPS